MNFVQQSKLAGQPIHVFTYLHQHILDCFQVLYNNQPLVSPLRYAYVYNSFTYDSNSDDEISTLSAYLGNMGCSHEMIRCFEVFAGQWLQHPPRCQQPHSAPNPITEIRDLLWSELPHEFYCVWRKLPKAQRFSIKAGSHSGAPSTKNKDLHTL